MNKLKQQYKTFLLKWNDNTLYKTSYITNRELFRHSVYAEFLFVLSVFFFYCGVLFLGSVFMVLAITVGRGVRGVYKGVADGVEDGKEDGKD